MGRSRAVEIDAEAETPPVPDEAGGEGAASLFDASADARVRILRRDNATQKMVTHGYFPATVTEEMVGEVLGGGYYRAQLVVPDPASGLQKIKRTRDFTIPGVYKPPQKVNTFEQASDNGSGSASTAAPAGSFSGTQQIPGGGDDLMQVLKAGIINTLLEIMKTAKSPGIDPMMVELMKAQAATQQQMMQFMLTLATKETPKQDSETKDVLGMMAKFKELMAPAGGPAVPNNPVEMFSSMLDAFKSFRDAADDVATPRGGDDGMMGSIAKVVEVVAEQHQMQKEARGQRITHAPVAGPAGGVAQKPEVRSLPEQPPMSDLPLWQRVLRQQAVRLLDSAASKHDPDVVAGMAIMFAPPAVKEALKVFFHRDEAEIKVDIYSEIPGMGEHPEWLGEFVEAIQFRLFPEEFAGDDEPEEEPVVEDVAT